jgi:hypothetical protein
VAEPNGPPPDYLGRPLDGSPWLLVYNDSGEEVPSRAVMKVTGLTAADKAPKVSKPDADDLTPEILLVNGETPIPAGTYGQGSLAPVIRIAYDSGTGTPALPTSDADAWGTVAGSWLLAKGKRGFLPWGDSDGTTALFARGYRAMFDVACAGGAFVKSLTSL